MLQGEAMLRSFQERARRPLKTRVPKKSKAGGQKRKTRIARRHESTPRKAARKKKEACPHEKMRNSHCAACFPSLLLLPCSLFSLLPSFLLFLFFPSFLLCLPLASFSGLFSFLVSLSSPAFFPLLFPAPPAAPLKNTPRPPTLPTAFLEPSHDLPRAFLAAFLRPS